MDTKRKLAVLCDYGLDDAIATLYLLEHADRFATIDILPVAGNFSVEKTFANAKRLLSCVESLPENVRIVDTGMIPQFGEDLWDIHGKDGMGDVIEDGKSRAIPEMNYEAWLSEVDASYTVLSLGSCTVTLDILQKKGALPLVMMGGNIGEMPNYKGYEFNHGVDPDSFAGCVKYAHASATLDTCHHPLCDLNKIKVEKDGLLGKLLRRYHEKCIQRNDPVSAVYDLVAVVYLLMPEKFTTSTQTDRDGNMVTVLQYIGKEPII